MVEVEEFDLDPEFQQHDIKPTNDAEDTHKAIVRVNITRAISLDLCAKCFDHFVFLKGIRD